mmetsp:Transcript_8475/g.20680  ORF Transcript_8475/g.20680 Transcript_8475/m.20680 type:complete len:84 (+) Transcript_8475:910-1161(+)
MACGSLGEHVQECLFKPQCFAGAAFLPRYTTPFLPNLSNPRAAPAPSATTLHRAHRASDGHAVVSAVLLDESIKTQRKRAGPP